MAAPLPAHSIIQTRIVGELYQQQVMNVMYWLWKSGDAADNFKDVMNNILDELTAFNALYDQWRSNVSASVTNIALYAQPVHPTRLTAVRRVPPIAQGTIVGTDLPTNTALTITKTSDRATRKGRGSLHLPGMVVEKLDPDTNEWIAAYRGDVGNFATKLTLALELDDFVVLQPVLWNPSTPDTTIDITGYIVQDTPRVERRRTLRVGR